MTATTGSFEGLLREHAHASGSRLFMISGDSVYTYAECDALVDAFARRLEAVRGVRGRFVGLMFTNKPAFVIGYLAIQRAGAKVVPLNPRLGADELKYMIADARMSLMLHDETLAAKIPAEGSGRWAQGGVAMTAAAIAPGPPANAPEFPADLSGVAVCIYTSGTTGRPKGALLTHDALVANARMCVEGMHARHGEECIVAVLPLFHAFASSACMGLALTAASRMLLIEQFQPLDVLNRMAAHGATMFMGVPAMYGVLASVDNAPRVPSLRVCVSGGAPLPPATSDAFHRAFGMLIHEGDGPTECGPATSINPVGGRVKTGTIGLPLNGVEMKIVDDAGNERPANEPGEIIVRSPSNFIGYLNQPGESAAALRNGWVHTGDIGAVDDDGYFSILGRKKEMLIVGGLNVYPREVEEYLLQHPAVAEAAVIGVPDGVRGETPVAFVTVRDGMTLDTPAARAFLRDKIAPYKIPKKVIVVPGIPRTAAGKQDKLALRRKYMV
ncbi:long-chain fatty acid--CoA ligase [bacterium]|nr:long-chain fatty acid--CoA ligase [bacterium]